MTSRDFCYWLQGFFELHDPNTIDEKQTRLIKQHLNLVFIHEIDPSHSDDPKVQGALQAVHDGVDVNELRERVTELENGPHAIDGPGAVDTLAALSPEKLKELEENIKKAQDTATKALNRPIPRRGGGETRYMC